MEAKVIRTDPRFDSMVNHLGYQSVDRGDAPAQDLMLDRELIRLSQDRLRNARSIPDDKLGQYQKAHLILAQAIAAKLEISSVTIYVASIPPASDRVTTAGMYSTSAAKIYISLGMMDRGSTMIDALVHELAHHRQYSLEGSTVDLTPGHAEAMTAVAAAVVQLVDNGTLDDYLKEVQW